MECSNMTVNGFAVARDGIKFMNIDCRSVQVTVECQKDELVSQRMNRLKGIC